ncbi:MAG: hypothetical protein IT355_17470 [Gemmatimonadaceae bacterium]|nr:hypothetical protein [Gemmatimonadaceae bacterium]
MTEPAVPAPAAAAPSPEDAAAASSRGLRPLLDAALSRAIAALAHDLRNSLGVVAMQVEAIAARSSVPAGDLRAIHGHAGVAGEHIERLADMTNALIAFARGRTSSDLTVIVREAAALVPLRPVTVEQVTAASVGVDPLLTRTAILEVLILALGSPAAPAFRILADASGGIVELTAGRALVPDESLEWVVQFRKLGGHLDATGDGLRLRFPPIA